VGSGGVGNVRMAVGPTWVRKTKYKSRRPDERVRPDIRALALPFLFFPFLICYIAKQLFLLVSNCSYTGSRKQSHSQPIMMSLALGYSHADCSVIAYQKSSLLKLGVTSCKLTLHLLQARCFAQIFTGKKVFFSKKPECNAGRRR
jgi:hypothetical protein